FNGVHLPEPAMKTALLIVDMINRFDFDGGAALAARAEALLPAILRLRRRFDAVSQPVIYANDNFMDWQGDFRHLLETCRADGGPAGRIATALAPLPGHFHLLKPKHSAFLGTPLSILLGQLGVRRLAIAGIATDSCVLATAQDARMHDYGIAVPHDATDAIDAARKRH